MSRTIPPTGDKDAGLTRTLPRVTRTFEALPGITVIDTQMGGSPGLTSAYLVRGSEPALIETGPTNSLPAVEAGLAELGIGPRDLAHIVVTHVHLDHAGGAGAYSQRFPKATVWAHERGVRHLVEPAKLQASATRVFGEEHMRRVFGPLEPLPGDRVKAASDGQVVSLGDRTLRILHAPGHAKHHAFIVDEETGAVFSGDGLGVHLPDLDVFRPATPPADFDLEAAIRNIGRVRDLDPPKVLFSHFGPAENVREVCDLAIERTRKWASIVEEAMRTTEDVDAVAQILADRTADELATVRDQDSEARRRLDLLTTYRVNAAGLLRYFAKRREEASS